MLGNSQIRSLVFDILLELSAYYKVELSDFSLRIVKDLFFVFSTNFRVSDSHFEYFTNREIGNKTAEFE